MPKGKPKTEGERIEDKFHEGYQKMRREYKKGRAAKKADGKKGGCECGK